MRNRFLVLAAVAISAACTSNREAPAPEVGRSARFLLTANAIPDRYVVVLKDDVEEVPGVADAMTSASGGLLRHVYQRGMKGFSATLPRAAAVALADDPRVRWVEEDGPVHATAVQYGATWGLDRIDQRSLPLDLGYGSGADGAGVTAYVLDTGIRITHREFAGRATVGFDAFHDANGAGDCNGHGTHVAGTLGGATWGVAKGIALVSVRVLDCSAKGAVSDVIAGVEWVTGHHSGHRSDPSVAILGVAGGVSPSLDLKIQASIASGVTWVVPAGNDAANACNYSPSRVPEAITVGGTTAADGIAPFSNQGSCVDLFAPGDAITSASAGSDVASATLSGTSMAASHVAGAAALFLDAHPTATPATVAQALIGNATPGHLSGLAVGSPNLALYGGFIAAGPADAAPPTAALTAPLATSSPVSGIVSLAAEATDDVGVSQVIFVVDGAYVASDTTAPYEATWNTALVENGAHALVVRAYDAAGNVTASDAVEVNVENAGFAAWDDAAGAPVCVTTTPACRTGLLTVGRAQLGPEPHQPNTIAAAGTCPDGTSGAFHVDESVDSVSVATVDGSDLAVGKPVRIAVAVWSYSNYLADRLDLYAADDAARPDWKRIATLAPVSAGAQVLTAHYSLPAGDHQVIRASLRYLGAARPCSSGAFDDRDDLVFAVGAGTPDTTPPAVTLTAPAEITGPVTVSASATDDGAIDRVEFLVDGAVFATAGAAPYTVVFAPSVPGTWSLTARAFDYAGLATTSAPVTVTLLDVVAPVVALGSPSNGAALRGSAVLSASATDAGGVEKVELLVDGAVLATVTAPPYQTSWDTTAATAGSHTVSAKAYDGKGNSSLSAVADVTVDNTAPVASIAAPAGGATFSGSVPVDVTISDAGTVTRVDLYANDLLVASDLDAPWSLTWTTGAVTGPVSLVARARDAAGNVGRSAAVAVVVQDVTAPAVAISAPLPGAHLRGIATVTATASDDIGVSKVEFFVDGVLLSSDVVAPWGAVWDTSGPSGARVLTARAFDGAGNSASSTSVTVTVDNLVPTVELTAPSAGATLAGVTELTANGSDDVAVARVDFYVGGVLVGSDADAPYAASWDSTRVPDGNYPVVASAVDVAGNVAETAPVDVTVANPIPETARYFEGLKVPVCGAGSAGCFSGTLLDGRAGLGPEQDAPNTIRDGCADGATGTYHIDESLDSLTVATLDGTRLAPGKQVRITATAWIYSAGSDRLDLYYAGDAFAPTWHFIATLAPTSSGLQTLTATYTLPAALPTGTSLQAIRGALRYDGAARPCSTGSYDDHDDLAFAVIVDAVKPIAVLTSPAPDAVVSGKVTLAADAGDGRGVGVARVDFYDGATLIGSDATPPYSIEWNTFAVLNERHSLAARAVDLAGNPGEFSSLTVSVSNDVLTTVAEAAYDTILKAPKCKETAYGCTTGALVKGRGSVGAEPNQPNTIYGRCADGAIGKYEADESLESLTITAVPGTTGIVGLAAGQEVAIEASAWVYSVISDRLDLYHAKDAASPVWTFIATVEPGDTGLQTLRAVFTLPTDGGSLQAIRGVFRFGGTPAPCVPGSYNDHDDLVFATMP